jgi:hypothetical protein
MTSFSMAWPTSLLDDLLHVRRVPDHVGNGDEPAQGGPVHHGFAGDEHVDDPRLDIPDNFHFLAELFVGEDLDFDPAVGLLLDKLCELHRSLVPGVLRIGKVAELEGIFSFFSAKAPVAITTETRSAAAARSAILFIESFSFQ